MSLFKTEVAVLHVLRRGTQPIAEPPTPGAWLDILVSDALSRYWILDRPAGTDSIAELDLYAADRFAEIYGDDPAEWVIRVDPQPRADRWLACAIPILFARELAQSAVARGWRVRHVQARFIREFNAHCRQLGREAVFCVASQESTTIGLIADGRWQGIRVHPPLDRSTASFQTLLRRDSRHAGVSMAGVEPVIVGSLRKAAR